MGERRHLWAELCSCLSLPSHVDSRIVRFFSSSDDLALTCIPDVITLDILRAIQGIGAAATMPAALGILAHEFPPSRARGWAFATFSAGAPTGGVFGTVLGGALTEFTSKTWRSHLWLMAGINALSVVFGVVSISSDRTQERTSGEWTCMCLEWVCVNEDFAFGVDRRIDWMGCFLASAGLVLIVFVLGQGEIAPLKWRTGCKWFLSSLLRIRLIEDE